MKLKTKTTPDLSLHSVAHQQAIADGEEHYWMWSRNVIDEYKELTTEEIKAELKAKSFPYAVCMENWIYDINLSSAIRNANAFGTREIFYLGNKRFDRRGAMGCIGNYTDVQWLPTVDDFIKLKERYTIIGLDNIAGAKPINEHIWRANTMLVFGSEGVGLTPAMQTICDELVYIPQHGSIRSLNVATASGIVMFDYVNRYRPTAQTVPAMLEIDPP